MTTRIHISDVPLPDRPDAGHKGTFGRVLVVGGSVGMSGAVALSSTAALRAGAGLVTAAIPRSIQEIVAAHEPCYMTAGLSCDKEGQLEFQPADVVRELVDNKSVVAVGPGMGQSRNAADLIVSLLKESSCPVVLDADALNLAAEFEMLQSCDLSDRCVVTPHPGEFSRLSGSPLGEIQQNREEYAEQFALKHKVVVVLKGAGTVVSDGETTYVNTSGNSGMATGGSGDVLTGLLSGLIAQGLELFPAAALAVYVHGVAGDLAAERHSARGLIASDLLRFIGAAWLKIQQERSM